MQSLESQKLRCSELAALHNVQIVDTLDEAKSAKEPGRPDFNEIVRRIDAGEVDGIIAWHPNRLSRNEIDAAAITYRLRKGRLKDLLFCQYTFVNSPEGIMMLQMALSQSQYESSKLSIDVTRGIEDKLALGWYPHRAPLGYVNNKHLLKGQRSISPDPERFALLQQAWKLLLTGSYNAEMIRHLLNDSWGFRTPVTRSGRGGNPLPRATFYKLLGNPFYMGQMYHAGKLYMGAHESMVTKEEFARVQHLLRRERTATEGRALALPKASDLAFTGLIRCGDCGSQITVTVKTKPSGRQYIYYHCSNSRGICPRRGIREDRLQAMIAACLEKVTIDEDFYDWAVEVIEAQSRALLEGQEDRQAQRTRAINEVQKRLDTLLDIKLNGLISDAEFTERRERLMTEKNRLVEEMDLTRGGANAGQDSCLNVARFMYAAQDWLANGESEVKHLVAQGLVSNWTLTNGNLIPEYHPMIIRVADELPCLKQEKSRIELQYIGSENSKNEAFASIKSQWSNIWEHNRTLAAASHVKFPNISERVAVLSATGC